MKTKIEKKLKTVLTSIKQISLNHSCPILVAVTKSVGIEEMKVLYQLGVTNFAENRIDIAKTKKTHFNSEPVTWHFIGNIQSRKVDDIVDFADIIHSVDSLKIANKINKAALNTNKTQKVLLQVNIAQEIQKNGFDIKTLLNSLNDLKELKNINIIGLMAMAPLTEDESITRSTFRELKNLSIELKHLFINQHPELSMGMTNDYKIAIEEGSTMLRIGSALFEEGV